MARQDEWGRETADRLTEEDLLVPYRLQFVHDHFNLLQTLLAQLGLDDLATRLDALHHDFYTAVTEDEGE